MVKVVSNSFQAMSQNAANYKSQKWEKNRVGRRATMQQLVEGICVLVQLFH